MTRIGRISSASLVFFLYAELCVTPPASCQTISPTDPNIVAAANELNSIMPQGVREQTISVGVFDGATNTFSFQLDEEYPPGLPDFKKSVNGGPVKPHPVAVINSFNVKYQFKVINHPLAMPIFTLELPNEQGQMVEQTATADTSGQMASIVFHPYSTAAQHLTIYYSGGVTGSMLAPRLAPELGAFVVPYLLLTIIYEPPGGGSSAAYETTSTAGTTVSWDFVRSGGFVQTVDSGALFDALSKAAAGGQLFATMFGFPATAAALGQIQGALSTLHTTVEFEKTTTTTTQTTGQSGSSGWSLSLTDSYLTQAHKYPGQGDVFLVLENVLFAYLVVQNKVILSPVCYTDVRAQTISQIQASLPASIVDKYQALDFLLNPNLPVPPASFTAPPGPVLGPPGVIKQRLPRLQYFGTGYCETQATRIITLKRSDIQSEGTSESTSETVLTQVTGLVASIENTPGQFYTTTYASSNQQWTGTETAASMTLSCPDEPTAVYVHIYFDRVFGTFLALKANPAPAATQIAGVLTDRNNQPLANKQLSLTFNDRRYFIFTDSVGAYQLHAESLPVGAASLAVDDTLIHFTYHGVPVPNFKVTAH